MNADQAKFLAEHYAAIIESEIPTTAKVLAAVGRGNGDYKPDPKSRSAIQLARHIATADGWFVQSVLDGKFEFDPAAAEKAEEKLTTAADAVAFYEKSMRDKVKADAKAERQSASAQMSANEKIADARKEADDTKREADYRVAMERCDTFAGERKDLCVKDAKARFGK